MAKGSADGWTIAKVLSGIFFSCLGSLATFGGLAFWLGETLSDLNSADKNQTSALVDIQDTIAASVSTAAKAVEISNENTRKIESNTGIIDGLAQDFADVKKDVSGLKDEFVGFKDTVDEIKETVDGIALGSSSDLNVKGKP